MTELERLNRLETQFQELSDTIEQLFRDLELTTTNLQRGLKGQRIQTASKIPIEKQFPPDMEQQLIFEQKGDFYIIKTRQFLGPETFAKIAGFIRTLGGEYVSAGKDSHFRLKVNP